MKLKIRFSHIDIDSFIKRQDASLFSKLKTTAIKGAVKFTPFAVESAIQKRLQEMIDRYNAGIEIETVALLKGKEGEICGLAASIKDIDYFSLFLAAKPFIIKSIKSRGSSYLPSRIIDVIGDDDNEIIESFSQSISDDKKAIIAELLIDRYNGELCALVNEAAKKKGVDAETDKIVFKP